ncbi:hypothetical protein BTS2_1773 [Bacillus sp. TS-2]|nr:hypothetical protein BTS2_1773 [Bacillus sp. TS-2]
MKEKILNHYMMTINFVTSFHDISDQQWRTPIEKDKWTIAEVISHLTHWDLFILEKRIPYLWSSEPLPKAGSVEDMNHYAASLARQQSKETTIYEYIKTRNQLYKSVHEISASKWEVDFHIGTTKLKVYKYLNDLAEHDSHHLKQIKQFLALSN